MRRGRTRTGDEVVKENKTPMKSSKVKEDGDCGELDSDRGRRGRSERRRDYGNLVGLLQRCNKIGEGGRTLI